MNTKLLALAAVASLSLTMISAPVQASSVNNVHVTMVVPNNAGVLQFFVDATRSGAPVCATATTTAWTISTNTMAGQTLASVLLTALAAGLPIDIGGIGTCEQMSTVETVGYISLHK